MTWRTIAALIMFVAVCGLIAYIGDLIGRRMGKRRHSFFGLRPRYTAIIATAITGMIIAVFTIAFMMVASSHVRTLLLKGEQILKERKAILNEYHATLQASKMIAKELGVQKTIAEKARRESKQAVEQKQRLAEEISKIDAELERAGAALSKNQAELNASQSQLKSTKGSLSTAREEISLRRKQIEKQKADIIRLTAQRAKIASLFVEEMGEAASKWPKYIALRERRIIFSSGQEIARGSISNNLPVATVRARINALLKDADKYAREKGAKTGDNGLAVVIMPKRVESNRAGQGRFLKESENIDAIAEQIADGTGDVVARVVSVGNSVEGEQVFVEVLLNYNRLIYPAGTTVASAVIDGRESRGRILEKLTTLLRRDVRSAAMGKGLIPSYDEDGQPSIGQLSWDELYDAVDRIKESARIVRVRAEASSNTWSAGPLMLNLNVESTK
jgi:uncharacterized protein (DUF3084 family)